MATSLAALSKLKYPTLEFQWGASYPDQIRRHPVTRSALPALTTFNFDGLFNYSEGFVAQIDAPRLDWLEMGHIFKDEDFDFSIPQLRKFIDRSEKPKPSQFRRADLDFQPRLLIINFVEGPSFLKLSIQEDAKTQVLSQISTISPMRTVDRLVISSGSPEYSETGDGI
ncbi:hypothetical protein H4582DRAFT_2097477 [Lactarius indigo]|nr:hypothetical protein H4582DRAFT_2097477 [Lactarius indigo]